MATAIGAKAEDVSFNCILFTLCTGQDETGYGGTKLQRKTKSVKNSLRFEASLPVMMRPFLRLLS